MPKLAELTTVVDRRLVGMISARARRRSPILRLLPDRWLGALLASSASRLRNRLVTGLIALSILILGAALWLTLP
jgi:hypothetical protein